MKHDDYKKLKNTNQFSLRALVVLSKLRRKVAEHGYEFFDLKEGETILLLEAARISNCKTAISLAKQFLDLIGIKSTEFSKENNLEAA